MSDTGTSVDVESVVDRPDGQLDRTLGVGGLVVHYITSVMGVGVLVIPGLAWDAAGPLALVAWLILIIYSYPFALIFARLSMRFTTSRGVAQFVEIAFGPRQGRITALFLLFTLLVANPLLGIAAGRYLLNLLGVDASHRQVVAVGAGLILASIVFNLFGVRIGARFQGGILGLLIAFLVGVIVVALPQGHTPHTLTTSPPHGLLPLGSALLICFFGFIGWENAAPVVEEVKNPRRNFPRAILIAVLLVGALYFGMGLTVTLLLPPGSGGEHNGLLAFASVLEAASSSRLATAGNLVAFVLMLLTTNAWSLGTSRVVFSLAREGLLPKPLARVGSRNSVPYRAVLFLIPGYGIPVVYLLAVGGTESDLITASSAAFLLVFLAAFVAGIRLLESAPMRATACSPLLSPR